MERKKTLTRLDALKTRVAAEVPFQIGERDFIASSREDIERLVAVVDELQELTESEMTVPLAKALAYWLENEREPDGE